MRATFHDTVDILVKAYLNGTLVQGDPCGCAIGNLIAARCGFQVESNGCDEATWDGSGLAGFDWFYVLRPAKLCGNPNLSLGQEQLQMTA